MVNKESFDEWPEYENRKLSVSYTSKITWEDLGDDFSLAVAPGIFQKRVEKAFELRVTVFGNHVVAARLDLSDSDSQAVDSRAHLKEQLRVYPFDLPVEIRERCLNYMSYSRLVFCCFDFIVTPEDEYVFLEANQMGQFLWLEEKNPDIPMLDIMCRFLMSARADFEWSEDDDPVRFQNFPGQ